MKYYEKLLELGCFTREQLVNLVESPAAANMLIYEYQKKRLIEKVKKDFYAVISIETRQPVLSRYQLASKMFPDACLSHHSAFEVYGYGNQVFYECYVATAKRFTEFEYDGVRVPFSKSTSEKSPYITVKKPDEDLIYQAFLNSEYPKSPFFPKYVRKYPHQNLRIFPHPA